MIISLNTALDLKIFSPREPIGILILFLGLIFTGMIFYIIYAVSTNKESLEDKKIRTQKESLQQVFILNRYLIKSIQRLVILIMNS